MADGVAISKYVNRGRMCVLISANSRLAIQGRFSSMRRSWEREAIENIIVDYSARSHCGRR
jgi:hypothetical protein